MGRTGKSGECIAGISSSDNGTRGVEEPKRIVGLCDSEKRRRYSYFFRRADSCTVSVRNPHMDQTEDTVGDAKQKEADRSLAKMFLPSPASAPSDVIQRKQRNALRTG